MTTLATMPVYAPPARETQVIFTLTGSGANFVRVWVTIAPPDSELRAKLEESTQSRVEIYKGEGGDKLPLRRKFDKGGKYTLVAQEYIRGASDYGGGYEGSPDSAPSETKVGSEATLELFIGQRMTAELAASGDAATLVLWVWDDTIQATTVAVHGEASPALQSEQPTARALAAIESATVQAALDDLAGITVDNAIAGWDDFFNDFIVSWNSHVGDLIVHQDPDTENSIPAGLRSPLSVTTLKEVVGEVMLRVRYHYTNDAQMGGTTGGRDSADYHNVGSKKNDTLNMPILAGVGDAEAFWALADLHRSYEAHRVSTAFHDTADDANPLPSLPPLLAVASAFFSVLASTSPTAAPAQSSGAAKLIGCAHFAETPL